jgi:hypothetical protein
MLFGCRLNDAASPSGSFSRAMSGPHAERHGLCDVQADAEDHPLLDGDGFLARHGRGLVGQGIRATAP